MSRVYWSPLMSCMKGILDVAIANLGAFVFYDIFVSLKDVVQNLSFLAYF